MSIDNDNFAAPILEAMKHIAETESVQKHYDENGNYIGATVTYKNPIIPELKVMYHPYIPLQIYNCAVRKNTEE